MNCNFMNRIAKDVGSKSARKAALTGVVYWFLLLVYLEIVLHIVAFGAPDGRFAFVLGFSFVFACAIALVTSFLPGKANLAVTAVVTVVLIILFGSQMVYYFVFRTLYSVALIQQGGAAITSFWKETLLIMWDNLPWLLLLFVPLILLILLRKCRGVFAPSNGTWRVIVILAAVLVQVLTTQCLRIGGSGYFSNHYFYYNNSTTTDQATERFGLLTAFRLDILMPNQQVETEDNNDYFVPEPSTAPTQPEDGEKPVEYNVLDIDFDELNTLTEDEKILAINQYCASLTGTNKNEYTGMLSDYNLIMLCAESFATGAIHEELTPTLYRLANEGIVFNNFYNTYPNNTTDGEYTFCMGLYPDVSRNKAIASFYASRNSYLPFCMGNVFAEQRGIKSYGYHGNEGSYYGRDQTHPNMGYEMKFDQAGLTFTTYDPTSDLEMMQQSVDDYISADEQFHAYYMTYSGHLHYDIYVNPMAKKNWEMVEDLEGLSYTSKCYLACNIELDKALEYLMQRLEEAGVADKTAIVLVGDHYPYGVSEQYYSELVGYSVDEFSKYKSSLIFWVGGLEENIVVDEYCCNADILPTILNLWGFSYDSRMLAGTDVFSDGTHVAVLSDMSFLTDQVWLNASTGEVRYLVDESELPENYVDNMIKLVKSKFTLSENILNTAYYNFVFEEGSVTINWESWGANPDAPVVQETEPPEETTPTVPDETTGTPDVPDETTSTPDVPAESTPVSDSTQGTPDATPEPPQGESPDAGTGDQPQQ